MEKKERPTITLQSGESYRAVDQAGKALQKHCERFRVFQRGGELVRAVCLPERHEDKWLKRPKGTIELQSLSPIALTEIFTRIVRWKQGTKRVDCPQKIARDYIARTGMWRVPVLAGIISSPILRKDGTALQRRGYDRDTRLLLVRDHGWPRVPEHPERSDAEAALRVLRRPFEQFPFTSDAERAVHIACILTAIQRRLLAACPIFGYSAPTQRSGKSLLAESVAILATGNEAPASALSGDREEIRKMILSTLRAGYAITNLDNVPDGHPLASPDLAKAITQPSYSDRVLGESRSVSLSTNVLWTATGNNLSFRTDLSSRALLCRIDARMERPETRTFQITDLKAYLKDHRKELVVAALTILRAFHEAGAPRQGVEPWGGFDEWSRSIREPLVWLGMADPCKTRQDVLADDPEREEISGVFRALHHVFGEGEFSVKKLIDECNDNGPLRLSMPPSAVTPKEIDSRRLGWWLKKSEKRIAGNLRLERTGERSGTARWQMVRVDRKLVQRFPRER